MKTPDFFIIGAPKCGTTALCDMLSLHPDVHMGSVKEPFFFSAGRGFHTDPGNLEACEQFKEGNWYRGWEWYEKIYADKKADQLIGEGSTIYLWAEDCLPRIEKYAPEATFVCLLRDPVERLFSHYWESKKVGTPLRYFPSFETMVDTNHPLLALFSKPSHYKACLTRWARFIQSGQLLLLNYEDFKRNNRLVLDQVSRYIGIEPTKFPEGVVRQSNMYFKRRIPRLEWLIRRYGYGVAKHLSNEQRARLAPIRKRIDRWNRRDATRPMLSAEYRAKLIPRFEQDVDYVEKLLDRDLSHWKRV